MYFGPIQILKSTNKIWVLLHLRNYKVTKKTIMWSIKHLVAYIFICNLKFIFITYIVKMISNSDKYKEMKLNHKKILLGKKYS